ncbi:hypothetical protein GV829_12235 [Sphingomonas lacunae]|uniref:ATPase n=1 Tax=Sphingomonas lacunae TaxID=2698828 RepID=A0A6M4AVK2_9SPHN|nr:hypothetical protein [Sphingomonas lacunae]QJQ33114.1 hypothetical protein GV829_12235 [Sphingomonas lacunae]
MTGERKIVGIWPAAHGTPSIGATFSRASRQEQQDQSDGQLEAETQQTSQKEFSDGQDGDAAGADPALGNVQIAGPEADGFWVGFDEEPAANTGGFPWSAAALGLLALLWTAVVLWTATQGFVTAPVMDAVPGLVSAVTAPVAVLLLAWMIIERGSERSVRRHLHLLEQLRVEQRNLTERLALMDRLWHDAQATLANNAAAYAHQASEAGRQIEATSAAFESRMREAVGLSAQINEQGDAARRHMESLIIALPKVDDVAQRAAETMREASQAAYQFGGQLEAQIAALRSEAAETGKVLGEADRGLAERIDALIAATGAAQQGAVATGEQFAEILARQRESALALLADLAGGMDGSVSTVEQRFDAARTMLDKASTRQLAALARGISDAETRAGALTAVLNSAIDSSGTLDSELTKLVEEARERVDSMASNSADRLAALSEAVAEFQTLFARLGEQSDSQMGRVSELGDKAATLLSLLGDVTREVDDALPAAIARLQEHVAQSVEELAVLPPLVEANAEGVGTALEQLYACEAALEQQVATLAAIDRTASETLAAQAKGVEAVGTALDALAARMAEVGSTEAPAMLATLSQAEQSADAAAERARNAILQVVRSAAGEIEQAIADAIDQSANEAVTARIAGVTAAADEAVASATAASDRLMRQLITIADSSAALESRAEAVRVTMETHDRETLSRQLSLLTESLQSTAVDITRVLSTDVADQAWSAYLKGDRGIFARRAVRLLSASEARELLARYQDDDDFRGLVNRYIHDFEAMLRSLLDTRDGSSLSVTLLSSDVGKVYVALAQAIERLRS